MLSQEAGCFANFFALFKSAKQAFRLRQQLNAQREQLIILIYTLAFWSIY